MYEMRIDTTLSYFGTVKAIGSAQVLVDFDVMATIEGHHYSIKPLMTVENLRTCKVRFIEFYEQEMSKCGPDNDGGYDELKDRGTWAL